MSMTMISDINMLQSHIIMKKLKNILKGMTKVNFFKKKYNQKGIVYPTGWLLKRWLGKGWEK